VLVNR